MKRPAVFFDRDNTLIANDGYLGDPSGVKLIAGAATAVARARRLGFAVVTFSNQSGVARGMFPEEAVHAVNARLDEMLVDQDSNAVIDRHEFCLYHPQGTVERYKQESELRKPRPGMIHQAAERLDLDLSKSWVIGDAPRDIAAGKSAGCRTILFQDASLQQSPATAEDSSVEPEFKVATLAEAIDIIGRTETSPAAAETTGAAESSSNDAPATEAASAPTKKQTFAERVRAGTYQPARPADPAAGIATPQGPKRAVHAMGDSSASSSSVQIPNAVIAATEPILTVKQTEPLSQSEQLKPLLKQVLDEVRLIRQQSHQGSEFSVPKLLAGIVQVLVLPVLFFAYLHRDTPTDLQSLLMLATFLQTLTIALLIMGRQSS